jgi:predicted amidohydrolase
MTSSRELYRSEDTFTAAAIQLMPADSVAKNLENAESLLGEAASRGADIIVLPENFAYYGQSNISALIKSEGDEAGLAGEFLQAQAQELDVWIVGGTIPVLDCVEPVDMNRPYARSFLFNPQGEIKAYYDKIHLFDADISLSQDEHRQYRESDSYSAGNSICTVPTDFANIGLTVCYDLRFPELYRNLADQGADIIAVPSAFTANTGEAHWEVLLRARAIENQLFIVGANLVDRDHPKRGLWGGSAIIDPWGTILDSVIGNKAGIAIADINIELIRQQRRNIPVRQHRKL